MTKTAENQMSKMEAVRQGLQDLGNAAMPKQLHGHIREKYGVEMNVDHISNYKSTILKGPAKAGKKTLPSVNGTHAVTSNVTQAATPKPAKMVGLADQVAMLKSVAAAIGKEEAKKIIDLL